MAFRRTFSRVENAPQARAEFSLDIGVVINGFRLGRIQSISWSMQAGARPALEIGSDRAVEFVPGVKQYQGRVSSMLLQYGDLVKRLASVTGTIIDASSRAATLTSMPEFDIVIARRGTAGQAAPTLYAPAQPPRDLAGSGGIICTLIGCVIQSADINMSAQETLIMENVSIAFVDQVLSDGAPALQFAA